MTDPDELNIELAKRAWDQRNADAVASWSHTIQFGLAALRPGGVINGAGAAALLAFLSANAVKLGDVNSSVRLSMAAFVIGMLSTAIAAGGAYLSQMFFTRSLQTYEPTFAHPYIKDPTPDWNSRLGIILQGGTVLLVISSYVLFAYGCYSFFDLIHSVLANSPILNL